MYMYTYHYCYKSYITNYELKINKYICMIIFILTTKHIHEIKKKVK